MKSIIVMSIGPVQEFIAAARRTRDLWFGSFLLSELSRAAAKRMHAAGGKLVFPSPENPSDLEDESFSVANIVLAVLPEGMDPPALASETRLAVQERWKKFADEALSATEGFVRKDVWENQVNDVVEVYSAWTGFSDPSEYPIARKRAMRLLAARKSCRDFVPQRTLFPGLPKSSLDGNRETVLTDPAGSTEQDARRKPRSLRLKAGEQLDCVGIVKRVGKGNVPFPSVSRIAADPWLRGLKKTAPALFDELESVCRKLNERRLLASTSSKGTALFPYEGGALFPSRIKDLFEEAGIDLKKHDPADRENEALAELLSVLQKIRNAFRGGGSMQEPSPYLAILLADGDRMGKAISVQKNEDEHRMLSQSLSRFAGDAAGIVEKNFGVCIYAGGDDVLAFLPVDTALDCAETLSQSFAAHMKDFGDGKESPTLSVGVAIAHCLENLEDLLAFGRKAEKTAKGAALPEEDRRNALAVVLRTRGSDAVSTREQWHNGIRGDSLRGRLLLFADAFLSGALSNKLPYELRERASFYRAWKNDDALASALHKDVLLVLSR